VTDFGRTGNLSETARLRAEAQNRNVNNTRAQVLLEVEQAYYQELAADNVLRVAQAALENRQLTLRQVQALAQSSLRSTLDVSFAEVAVSEAELVVVRAENDLQGSRARLGAALGSDQEARYQLTDEPLPPPLSPEVQPLLARALQDRPDLAALQFQRDAAQRFAEAEKRLRYPSISVLGVAGALPSRDPRLHATYGAAGLNVSVPVLNGGLLAARQSEAEFRARAAEREVEALALSVGREVRLAWFEVDNAFRRLDVTARLTQQAGRALRLAQARYDSGLGGIVELSQAQLAQLSAEVGAVTAKYDYLGRRAALAYAMGDLQ
jgi:outer membrane protein